MRNRSLAGLAVSALLLAASGCSSSTPTEPAIERFMAFAANLTGTGRGGSGMVQIVIERWSTDAERDMLRETLLQKGPDQLLSTLQKIKPRTGFMRLPNTVGWDLYFARSVVREDGTRQVLLASDRHIAFGEVTNQTRSLDYDFTIVDIRFDKEGKGSGEIAVAAKVAVNEKTKHLEIENYSTRPL